MAWPVWEPPRPEGERTSVGAAPPGERADQCRCRPVQGDWTSPVPRPEGESWPASEPPCPEGERTSVGAASPGGRTDQCRCRPPGLRRERGPVSVPPRLGERGSLSVPPHSQGERTYFGAAPPGGERTGIGAAPPGGRAEQLCCSDKVCCVVCCPVRGIHGPVSVPARPGRGERTGIGTPLTAYLRHK